MTCPDCERYKESARNWRHKAYELSGRPLPWEGGDTWVGLTDEEVKAAWAQLWYDLGNGKFAASDDPSRHTTVMFARAIEAKLKEKNT